jgi:4-carboxymuconolactone decarboxylase
LTQLRVHVGAALNVGLTPVEIKEAIYHCAPYTGFPKALDALAQANEVFAERHTSLPLESQRQVEEDERFEKGLAIKVAMFGETIRQRQHSALGSCEPQLRAHVQGNLNVGNDRELMIEAITQCVPLMGFPGTLNAPNCVTEKG